MSAVRAVQVRPGAATAGAAAPKRTAGQKSPDLRVVRAPQHARTRASFVAMCMALLVGSLLGALVLNTSMAQGEYERFALQSRLVQATQGSQHLAGELERAASPARLAEAARALGMVPAAGTGYVRLSDGVVLGKPVPAGAGG